MIATVYKFTNKYGTFSFENTLTGHAATVTDVPMVGGEHVTMTGEVLATCFAGDRVQAVELHIPGYGRSVIFTPDISAIL